MSDTNISPPEAPDTPAQPILSSGSLQHLAHVAARAQDDAAGSA